MGGVSFGKLDNIGGKSVVTGMNSGFDTKAIIDGLKSVKEIPLKNIEDTIKVNNKKITSLYELKDKLESFHEAANALRNIPSVDKSGNSFNGRKIKISSDSLLYPDSYVDVTSNNGADLGSYEFTVTNLAKAETRRSQSFSSDSISVTEAAGGTTPGSFSEGTFQINGVGVSISMGDSLVEIKASINAVSSQSGVIASIVKVSDTDYRLVLKSAKTGVGNTININDPSGALSQVTFTTTQNAENAAFTINGINVTRSENIVDDVLQNLTIHLKQVTGVGNKVYADISNDPELAKSGIKNFVGAYNDLILFMAKQHERDKSDKNLKFKETAVLGNEPSLRIIESNIMSEISSYVKGISNGYITIGEIGLNFFKYDGDDDNPSAYNLLRIEDMVLDNALATKFEDVRKVFEFDFQSTSKTISNISRSNNLKVTSFKIDIDTSRADPHKAKITYNTGTGNVVVNADYSGSATNGLITAPDGGPLEGMKLLYVGSGINVVDASFSQGIADRLYNYIENLTKSDGDIDQLIESYTTINSRYTKEVEEKKKEVDIYIEKLKLRFSKVEEALSEFNSTIMFLKAQIEFSRD